MSTTDPTAETLPNTPDPYALAVDATQRMVEVFRNMSLILSALHQAVME